MQSEDWELVQLDAQSGNLRVAIVGKPPSLLGNGTLGARNRAFHI